VALQHALDEGFTALESFLPARFTPLIAIADHRAAQAIGVVVQIPEGGALGTDMALAPHIVVVGAHGLNLVAFAGDNHATHAFAEGAGAVLGVDWGGGHIFLWGYAKSA